MGLNELYTELILHHNRYPHAMHAMEGCSHKVDAHNPLCGDQFVIYTKISDDKFEDISFTGQGCAISKASASLMGQLLKGRECHEVESISRQFISLVKGTEKVEWEEELRSLEVFSNVAVYPARVKCALLAWHAILATLNQEDRVSTE